MTTVRLLEDQYTWVAASDVPFSVAESNNLTSEEDFFDMRLATESHKALQEKGRGAFTSYDEYRRRRGLSV